MFAASASFLIMSDGTQIRGVIPKSSDVVVDMFKPLQSPKPVGVDFDAVERKIYWTDISDRAIYRSSFGGTRELLLGNLSRPEGIAVDWIGRKVYYSDDGSNTIGVVTMDGQKHIVLMRNISRPRAIVLDPENGYNAFSLIICIDKLCIAIYILASCFGPTRARNRELRKQTWRVKIESFFFPSCSYTNRAAWHWTITIAVSTGQTLSETRSLTHKISRNMTIY